MAINELDWHKWEQEAYDYADNRYNSPRFVGSKRWEVDAWRAWSAGRDPIEFVDEFVRDGQPEH